MDVDARVNACQHYAALALSCYGPRGRLKALQAAPHTPASVLTSVSGRLFNGMRHASPFAQLLVSSTALAQHAQFGDGGLTCLFLAARMIEAALGVCATRQELHEACAVLHAAGDWLCEALESSFEAHVAPASAPSLQHLVALCRSMLAPKLGLFLDGEELQQLALLVVEACVMSLPGQLPDASTHASQLSLFTSRAAVHVLSGSALSSSRVLRGVVVPVGELALASLDAIARGRGCAGLMYGSGDGESSSDGGSVVEVHVLLVADTLEPADDAARREAAGAQVPEPFVDCDDSHEDYRLNQMLAALAAALPAAQDGAVLLACQKGVHPLVHEWLLSRGVVSLPRLGAATMDALALSTGLCPLADLRAPPPARARLCAARLCVQVLGTHPLVVLQAEQAVASAAAAAGESPVTLALGCPSDSLGSHLQGAVEAALKLLRVTVAAQARAVLPGGGRTEAGLAAQLGEWCDRHRRAGLTGKQVCASCHAARGPAR